MCVWLKCELEINFDIRNHVKIWNVSTKKYAIWILFRSSRHSLRFDKKKKKNSFLLLKKKVMNFWSLRLLKSEERKNEI